jgi:glycosyltransferase involved in cell wall biosynthesis
MMSEGQMTGEPDGAVFVVSRSTRGQTGPLGMWMMAAGWAAAGETAFGRSWLITEEGVLDPARARALASRTTLSSGGSTSWKRHIPTVVKTAMKDVRDFRRARRFARSLPAGEWDDAREIAFVWQRHDLFQTAGHDLARRLGAPLVLCVDAPVVWEARRWGVRRPGWGGMLERFGENPLLRSADVILAVSEEVAEQVGKRGVPPGRILVTPNGVDIHVFTPDADGESIRRRYGLDGRFVVGWIGGFHKFHGLDLAIDMAARLKETIPGLTLLLVGDGVERQRLESRVAELGLDNVMFTGTVGHSEVPAHIAAMDLALVLSPKDGQFHYSPIKLREYMACARPVVASRAGELAEFINEGVDGLLVEPGSVDDLAAAVRSLHESPELRSRLGEAGRDRMVREGSWERQVDRTYEKLTEIRARSGVR